jgi:hypothetical protein
MNFEGMQGIVHKDRKSTSAKLFSFGLQTGGGGIRETELATLSGADRPPK